MRVMLFSGTSEGRELAEFCKGKDIPVQVHVATEYGKEVMGELPVVVGRLNQAQMIEAIENFLPDYVVDATHPYAVEVTKNISLACEKTGRKYFRVVRKSEKNILEKYPEIIRFSSIGQAVDYLVQEEKYQGENQKNNGRKKSRKNILAATGSKELEQYQKIPDYRKRLYVRAIPTKMAESACEKAGIPKEHRILCQGPFSCEENKKHLQFSQAGYFLTKESGKAGGFPEKIQAAREENVTILVIERPVDEKGYSLKDMKKILSEIGMGRSAKDERH